MRSRWGVLVAAALMATLAATGKAQNGTPAGQEQDALMVIAHGAPGPDWNGRVLRLVQQVKWPGPVGVAFLMNASAGHELSEVAAQLDQTAARIIVVPLMVSSCSEHYDEIRYYVGDLKMKPEHVHRESLHTKAELVLAPGMDDHPLISEILNDEVKKLSKEPGRETLVLVGHGPNDDGCNARWVEFLQKHADRAKKAVGFLRTRVVTLRDDAEKHVRDAATENLRAIVREAGLDSRVLVVPVLISVGRIQKQIRERLDGLNYQMVEDGLVDHPLTAGWILQQAQARGREGATTDGVSDIKCFK